MLVRSLGKRRSTDGWTRVVVEKPFGRDLDSAKKLNAELLHHFDETEIFRIDHYLGKETVQNLLALRFANGIFEPIWNRQFVDHVQITVAETIGIEGRAQFYEQAGAIRDVFQNHLLQLVALTAMEPPIDFTADSVRNEKVKVLRALHTPGPKHVVRGQYGRGYIEGEEVPGYREEPGVDPTSMTETYVAAKLFVDNWRWADTPFYIRAGKRLARRETTIAIEFKRAPHPPFEETDSEGLQSERARRPHSARRGRLARVRGEGAGPGDHAAHGPHGLSLRRHLPHGNPGGLRAPDPRLPARRRDALHASRRGRGAVVARGRDRRVLEAGQALVPELRGRNLGAGGRERARTPGRTPVATALSSIGEIERELAERRFDQDADQPYQRTSVMTHVAWVPEAWVEAAEDVLAGLAERHPSRTIVLVPEPDAEDGIEGSVEVHSFEAGEGRQVCTETIRLRLCGNRASVPASVVQPLLLPDIPVFLRWRGVPPFGAQEFEGLVDVVDRMIVDSTEWPELPGPYAQLAEIFDRVMVSDIAWARTSRWRPQLASLWPAISTVKRIKVTGTEAQAHLLAGWLRSRLDREIALEHEPSDRLVSVEVDGEPAPFPPGDPPDPSDLLSDELDRFTRDRVYEDAVRAT